MENGSGGAGKMPGGTVEEPDSAPGKVRRKMAVGEGRSMMHWMNQRPPIKRQRWVTMEEVAKHNTAEDAWTVFRGKVYDCTAFFDYHPGGAKYMLAVAGKDGTKLFDKFHAWVNVDFIMEKCLVGYLREEETAAETVQEEEEDSEEDSELARNTLLNSVGDGMALDNAGPGGTALDEMD